jgi:outer membrane protein assembly factor BamB
LWTAIQQGIEVPEFSNAVLIRLMFAIAFAFPITGFGADWPMRGRDQTRNPVCPDLVEPIDWRCPINDELARNIRWMAQLGRVSCGDPVIADGLVWVGTNNLNPRDPNRTEDAGVLMCFRESDGKFLAQYVSPRMTHSVQRVDFQVTSLASSPLVEGDRLWFCTNRCEVICLDISPLKNGAGEFRVEWKVDMCKEFGVVPCGVMIGSHASHCSIASWNDLIYVNTTNGRGYQGMAAPEAPSLVCFQKSDGKVRWKDNSPGDGVLEVQHGSPLVLEVGGSAIVVMGQGDGRVRGFEAATGKVLWAFDINPKTSDRRLFEADLSNMTSIPVFHDGLVYFSAGRHPEFGGGRGRLCCLDPKKRGDVSSEVMQSDGTVVANPNSAVVWEYRGDDAPMESRMHRALGSVAIHDGLLIAADMTGYVHCFDAKSGELLWNHDLYSQVVASPLIVGRTIYVASDDDEMVLLELEREKRVIGTDWPID